MTPTAPNALRWYLFTASHPGESRRFSDKLVNETLRRVLLTLWNVYSFFTNYANIDQFEPDQIPANWQPEVELDRWILSELNLLVQQVDDHLDKYNPTDAGRRIQEFIDALSNWYVRRSRRRFWKSESDTDKLGAYSTLYTCLTTVAKLMAPLAPFVAELMYRNLELRYHPAAPDSVHLGLLPDRHRIADRSPPHGSHQTGAARRQHGPRSSQQGRYQSAAAACISGGAHPHARRERIPGLGAVPDS